MVGASGERCPADESMLNSLRLRDLRNSATRHRDFCTGLISSNLSGVLLPEPVISNGNHLRSRSAGTNVDAGKIASGMGSDASSVAAARGALAASRDYSQSMLVEAPHPSSVLAAPNAAHGPEMHKILIVDCRPRANAMVCVFPFGEHLKGVWPSIQFLIFVFGLEHRLTWRRAVGQSPRKTTAMQSSSI